MSMYELAPPLPDAVAKDLAHLPLLQAQLLFRRGISGRDEAERFLLPDYDAHLHEPTLLHGVEVATARILAAVAAGEQVAIFSDYDCDGIPGGVILHDFFSAIGHEAFTNYIPHRHYEGFGLSLEAVEKLAEAGATLIITIDCGTSDVAAVARANELGVDVIVTDHHEPGPELPATVALVNPKLGEYPFPHLCGAAVVYKLVQVLIARGGFDLSPGWEKWWLDMVGVATIADMVPLTGENRVLAHFGLTVLRKSRRPGLQQLLKKARADQRYLTEDDIGFTIGPRINAASRMDTPEDAFRLLSATSDEDAAAHVEHLEKLNVKRRSTIAQITKELHQRIEGLTEMAGVLVFGNIEWRPALVGLAANKLAEEHRRPVFLWGRDGNGVIKGSARAGGEVSVVRLMEAAKELFLEYGGHHASGGFSVKEEHMFTFGDELNRIYEAERDQVVVAEPELIDAYVSLEEIDALLAAQRPLAPFGMENPKPLYGFQNVVPSRIEQFGKGKEHLKLVFATAAGEVEAIAFFATADGFSATPEAGKPLTLLAHAEQSFFMNRLQTRLRIVDIL